MSWHWYVHALLVVFSGWTWWFAVKYRATEVAKLRVENDTFRRRLTVLGADLVGRPGTQETLRRAFERLIPAGMTLDQMMRELLKGREDPDPS